MPNWCDSDFEDVEYIYRSRFRDRRFHAKALDKSLDEWYNTCTFEGAVETSLIAATWEQFEHEVASFYEGMERTYDDVRTNQSG